MGLQYTILFGENEYWWASGSAMENMTLRRLLEDPLLLARWARTAGCPERISFHVRVVELDEKRCPARGQVSRRFFDQDGVRLVPIDELEVEAKHLRQHLRDIEVLL